MTHSSERRFFAIVLCATLVIIGGMYVYEKRQPNQTAYGRAVARKKTELERLRASEKEQLSVYRWKNKKTGVIQIPIERAMQRSIVNGLKARHQGSRMISPVSRPSESGQGIHKAAQSKKRTP